MVWSCYVLPETGLSDQSVFSACDITKKLCTLRWERELQYIDLCPYMVFWSIVTLIKLTIPIDMDEVPQWRRKIGTSQTSAFQFEVESVVCLAPEATTN